MAEDSLLSALPRRQANNKDAGEELLELLKNPFADQARPPFYYRKEDCTDFYSSKEHPCFQHWSSPSASPFSQ